MRLVSPRCLLQDCYISSEAVCKPSAARRCESLLCATRNTLLESFHVSITTFRRLEVFLAVVESGSFIAGAERLGISHPSISNHIKALERQVGCTLFLRRKGIGFQSDRQGRRLYERGPGLCRNHF